MSYLEMTKKAFRKLHKDFRNNDLTNPRACNMCQAREQFQCLLNLSRKHNAPGIKRP